MTKFYQHLLALAFAVDEVNENPEILPNVTLGFHIYDSYSHARMTYRAILDLLFNSPRFVPNYECGIPQNIMGTVGGLESDTSKYMADILGLYKIPQVSGRGWGIIPNLAQKPLFQPLRIAEFKMNKMQRRVQVALALCLRLYEYICVYKGW